MATIALTRPALLHQGSTAMASMVSPRTLDLDTRPGQTSQPHTPPLAGNKHIPTCPPGPPPASPSEPPPVSVIADNDDTGRPQQSLLYPPHAYPRSKNGQLSLYFIDAAGVAAALDYTARQPLPNPSLVFPWLHGLHPNNYMQHAFFFQRRHPRRRTPCCLRGVTIVKADGQLHTARLKGAIAPQELLQMAPSPEFLDVDPQDGFSVRNFQIQAAKTSMTSDIVVYGTDQAIVESVGWAFAAAQRALREKHDLDGDHLPDYNTFICTSPFSVFETAHPEIIAVDSDGCHTGHVLDFLRQERIEMHAMTKTSEISHNVWLGPTPTHQDALQFDVLIECSDHGHLDPAALRALSTTLPRRGHPVRLRLPSSGTILPPTWSHAEADDILETCQYIYNLAHGIPPERAVLQGSLAADNDLKGGTNKSDACVARRILIHCGDGYTESTMLGIAYFSYSTGRPIPDAWLSLHTDKQRNFFAYPTDVALLSALSPRLVRESPVWARKDTNVVAPILHNEPRWFSSLDGSFPSRVLDYMYLGNLTHANKPDLLRALGITQILSVGETANWQEDELEEWGADNICIVQGVQDNGIDPLTEEFERCLEFIERGHQKGTATLVHCRVGVSRSATICIAEVMRSLKLSLPRAYCFVRARRLNVIIQPHLRFAYELLKWEEYQQEILRQGAGSTGFKRELEWGAIAREVALMNQPYVR